MLTSEHPAETFPLSSPQKEIWLDQMVHADVPLYNIGCYLRIDGPVDIGIFRRALQTLVREEDGLRIVLLKRDGLPVQTFAPDTPADLVVKDFSAEAEPAAAASKWMEREMLRPFRYFDGPLFRFALCKIKEDRYYWFQKYHHVIVDFWSVSLLVRRLTSVYNAIASGASIEPFESPTYADFVRDDQSYLGSDQYTRDKAFWLDQFKQMPETAMPRRHAHRFPGEVPPSRLETLTIESAFFDEIERFAKGLDSTAFSVFMGVLFCYLARISNKRTLCIGFSSLNRHTAGFKQTVGLSTKVVPTLLHVGPDMGFRDLLDALDRVKRRSKDHRRFPVGDVHRNIFSEGEPRGRLFDLAVSFTVKDIDTPLGGFPVELIPFPFFYTQNAISLLIAGFNRGGPVQFQFNYNLAAFDRDEILLLKNRLFTLLEDVLVRPDVPIRSLHLLPDAERKKIMSVFHRTKTTLLPKQNVHHLFERRVEETPDQLAVVLDREQLTYGELNQRANRLAHHLRGIGVGPEVPVGVCMRRSPSLIEAVLGIWKAGGAYVPMDPEYPEERLAYMLADSGAGVFLTNADVSDILPPGVNQICLDQDRQGFEDRPENPACETDFDRCSYVIYTSGTTGKPKGVMNTHGGLFNLLCYGISRFALRPGGRHLQFYSVSFDASVWELCLALCSGATLVQAHKEQLMSGTKLAALLEGQGITFITISPSMLGILPDKPFPALRTIIVGGEVCSPQLAKKWGEGRRFFNGYGPTEAAVGSTMEEYGGDESKLTIGRPLDNVRVYILDGALNPVPIGVSGELYVAGTGLARGYLNRPDLTAEMFIPDPFSPDPGARMYRTGDLAYWCTDGRVTFCGRIDDQVKVRGFRIELGEVEAALLAHPAVRGAAVTAPDHPIRGRQLIAYITADCGIDEIRAFLQKSLPDHMVPAAFVFMDKMPLNANSKVDRSALPPPDDAQFEADHVAPRQPVEEIICGLWSEVLGRTNLGVFDNFFHLGGHSLLATQLVTRLRDVFGVELSVRTIFEAPTVADLAEHLASIDRDISQTITPLKPLERPGSLPLSFAQQRLWFLDKLEDRIGHYNVPIALRLHGPLDVDALQGAINGVVQRHEILRTVFRENVSEPSRPLQEILPEMTIPLPLKDLSGGGKAPGKAELDRIALEHTEKRFDLSRGPLLRARLVRLGAHDHILLITLHHMVCDAWSLGVFWHELSALYASRIEGRPHGLPDVRMQYADFAAWQRDWLAGSVLDRQLGYWKHQLAGAPVSLDLPMARSRPPVQTFNGAIEWFDLDERDVKGLRTLCRTSGVTLFMVLHAAFTTLLSRYSGEEDIVIGIPVSSRPHRELEDLIGLFINMLPLRTDLSGDPPFAELLRRVKETTLDAFFHKDIPFDKLIEELRPRRSLSHAPVFQVLFELHGTGPESLTLPGLRVEPYEIEYRVAKYDLTLSLEDRSESIAGSIEYNTDLFDRDAILHMTVHFQNLIKGIVRDPDRPLSELPLLGDRERHRVLDQWSGFGKPYPKGPKVHQWFERRAGDTPNATALMLDGVRLSYQQLNQRANQAAHLLLMNRVGPGDIVAVCVERSMDMIAWLLAVFKAGATYLPLDPNLPPARLRGILTDAGAPLLLTREHRRADFDGCTSKILCPPMQGDPPPDEWENPAVDCSGDDAAYIIYTSGSSGLPKGVKVSHDALSGHILNVQAYYEMQPEDRVLQFSSIGVDTALEQIFTPLTRGAALVLRGDGLWSPDDFFGAVTSCGVTVADLPPSYFRELIEQWADRHAPFLNGQLRLIIVGGEVMPPGTLAQWHDLPNRGTRLVNAYGPTEATITATVFEFVADGDLAASTSPIGRPLPGRTAYILDRYGRPVPRGVDGELYLGGGGLAMGYHRRPEADRAGFVQAPFDPARGRLYRTGDRARWLPGGTIGFIGRKDNQVQIRGHRVELDEIEAALGAHPQVDAAAVITTKSKAGDEQLIAHIAAQPHPEGNISIAELRRTLREKLPEYMIPSAFAVSPMLPTTPSGKIDRRALPPLESVAATASGTRPGGSVEQKIADIWSEILEMARPGTEDNFFDLGGHSLLLIRLQRELREAFHRDITVMDLFQHPTIASQALFIGGEPSSPPSIASISKGEPREEGIGDIAVIGMAGRFPQAKGVDELWENLCKGRESVTFLDAAALKAAGETPELIHHPDYVPAGGFLEDVDLFDAMFFGFTPGEAELLDPQQRLFLECAHELLERAGYDSHQYGGRIGVYTGAAMSSYLLKNLYPNRERLDLPDDMDMGNDKDFIATRTSYKLNLRGPSMSINTACSSSLVAVHVACRSLRDSQCDMAMAGGVSIHLPLAGYLYREGGILSKDGHCRAFDANATGTVGGRGCAIVLLKRLADALADGDTIHAVIKGTAVNNDGAHRVGYTAPGVTGQAAVICDALQDAKVTPDSIGYVEAHGTGTVLGDPIEIQALTRAYRKSTNKTGFCAVGSIKPNVGHLDTAAGVAGLIKTILVCKHGLIPPSINFAEPNPKIDFAGSPFYVNTALTPWPLSSASRRAAVSSFGIGGTNAHVIVEQPPLPVDSAPSKGLHLLILSAKTKNALNIATTRLADFLKSSEAPFSDIAYTLQAGRRPFQYRRFVVCNSGNDAAMSLSTLDPQSVHSGTAAKAVKSTVFMFSGQGSQYPGMGKMLYNTEPLFREQVDICAETLMPLVGYDIRAAIFSREPGRTDLNQSSVTQVALFTLEYALARLWMSRGIRPWAMIGHSIGEYAAACLSGVLSLEDALRIVAVRGRLMDHMPEGAMLGVQIPVHEMDEMLNQDLTLAAHNAPGLCVLSGTLPAIEAAQQRLEKSGVLCRRIHVSHAFHSKMVEPFMKEFRGQVEQVDLRPPEFPYISTVTGAWITDAQATDPGYYADHLRKTVRFSEGIATLLQQDEPLFLEVGPGRTLTTLARQQMDPAARSMALSSLPHPKENRSDGEVMLTSLGRLWLSGLVPDWKAVHGEFRRRVELPGYPFEKKRYWIDPPPLDSGFSSEERTYTPVWRQIPLKVDKEGAPPSSGTPWLVFADKNGPADELTTRLRSLHQKIISVQAGRRFQRLNEETYQMNPSSKEDYDTLFKHLEPGGISRVRILHLWLLGNRQKTSLDRGFYSLLFLAQAMGRFLSSGEARITVVSDALHPFHAQKCDPEKAAALGAVRTIPLEYANIRCHGIDIDSPSKILDAGVLHAILDPIDEDIIAWRKDRFWRQDFEPTRINEGIQRLRDRGAYLITGGLGGMGLALASYLAETVRARLILTGRTPLPPRPEWAGLLDGQGAGRPVLRKIHQIRDIEKAGGEVMEARADVSSREQMRALLEKAHSRFGPIHGVIHAAGVPGGGAIQLKTREKADSVLRPKVSGTSELVSLLREYSEPLDFIVLCSSLTSVAPVFGQSDYCGANAFLDAFAQVENQQSPCFCTAINWDTWKETGMAVEAMHSSLLTVKGVSHPLLKGCQVLSSPDRLTYVTHLNPARHWVLDEHRIDGNPTLPGTAYLDLVHAVFEDAVRAGPWGESDDNGDHVIELTNVSLLEPLMVEDGEDREVRTLLHRRDGQTVFSVLSRTPDGTWRKHAEGRIGNNGPVNPKQHDIEALSRACNLEVIAEEDLSEAMSAETVLSGGPRFRNLKRVQIGKGQAMAILELPQRFAEDCSQYDLHPALLDVAAAFFSVQDHHFTGVPVGYDSVAVSGPLPGRIYSYAKETTGTGDLLKYDVTVMDEQGEERVKIKGFTLMPVTMDALLPGPEPADVPKGVTAPDAQDSEPLAEGLSTSDGIEAFRCILGGKAPQVLVIANGDFKGRMSMKSGQETPWTQDPERRRPRLDTPFAGARNDTDRRLCALWERLLGIREIGIHDDFFELGGHSLLGTQLIAKVREAFSVTVSLATLLASPTVAAISDHIHSMSPSESPLRSVSSSIVDEDAAADPLILIQEEGEKRPFFAIPGIGGNAAQLSDLAVAMGRERPFYGFHARGLDGLSPPHESIEQMAADYIGCMQRVQPHGPYILCGHSLGGKVAFEMARQLFYGGERVALLINLDSAAPPYADQMKVDEAGLFQEIADVYEMFSNKPLHVNRDRLRQLSRAEKLQYLGERLRNAGLLTKGGDLNHLKGMLKVFEANNRFSYDPKKERLPYPQLLIKAGEPLPEGIHLSEIRRGRTWGWKQFTDLPIKVFETPGNHFTMLRPPHVHALADLINGRLQRVLPEDFFTVGGSVLPS